MKEQKFEGKKVDQMDYPTLVSTAAKLGVYKKGMKIPQIKAAIAKKLVDGSPSVKESRDEKPKQTTDENQTEVLVDIFATYKGKEYKGTLVNYKAVMLAGKRYKSPSAAANSMESREKTSRANGWIFWNVKDKDGITHKIQFIRDEKNRSKVPTVK